MKYYRKALALRITQSRKQEVVAAALLYLVCRQQGLPILLIDFADCQKEHISALTTCSIQFKRELKIDFKSFDPDTYVKRFTQSLLEAASEGLFNTDSQEFPQDFNRYELEQRVHHLVQVCEWLNLHQSRKPQLIVGVCIILAGLSMDFAFGIEEVAQRIYMAPETVRNKLQQILKHPFFSSHSIQEILDQSLKIEQEFEDVSEEVVRRRQNRYKA